jgi:hypothetical protein
MKKLSLIFILSFAFLCEVKSQVIDDENGKTYYYFDNDKKQVKEIFHHLRQMKFGIRDGFDFDTIVYVKHGPYLKYHPNGRLECSGYFHYEKPDSIWKRYSDEGKLIGIDRYRNGQKID